MKDEHHGGNDQHNNYRSGKHTGFNEEWYDNLRSTRESWTKVSEQRIHENRGIYLRVKAGQTMKFIQPEGPNIIDVWFFGADIKDTSGEKYDTPYTAVFEGFILRKNSRIWSTVPYFRPMATYIDDNIDASLMPDDETWPVWHGSHCCPEANELGYGELELASCQTNAIEGLVDAGFDFETADQLASTNNMCIFQPMSVKNTVMASGNVGPTWKNTPFTGSKPGTFVEYYAEIDLLLAISHCPYGDQSVPPTEVAHFPIDVEVWDTGVKPQVREPFNDWRPAFKKRLERLKAKGHTGATGRRFSDD